MGGSRVLMEPTIWINKVIYFIDDPYRIYSVVSIINSCKHLYQLSSEDMSK